MAQEIVVNGQTYTILKEYGDAHLAQLGDDHFLLIPRLKEVLKIRKCEEIHVTLRNCKTLLLNELSFVRKSPRDFQSSRENQGRESNIFVKVGKKSMIIIFDKEMVLDRICVPQF